MKFWTLISLLFLCSCIPNASKEREYLKVDFDNHIHIMSPDLISLWKEMGIPFSRSEANYANIDTILRNTHAQKLNLIGMAYVYGNEEFYQGDDQYQKVKAENNYLFTEAKKYPKKIVPYFAIDPLEAYGLEEIERCSKLPGEKGLKLHFNTSAVYLTEPVHLQKIYSIFESAAENELPILLHFDNWHPKFGKPDIRLLNDSILRKMPALKITIAHFGTSGGFNAKTKRIIDEFVRLFERKEIPARHQIQFDISAVALDKDSEGVPKLSKEEFDDLGEYVRKLGLDRIVFGSDYPLYSSEEYAGILREKLGLSDEELQMIMRK